MIEREYFVYIMTNPNNTVFYTGVTNDLALRVDQHKQKMHPKSFTARYNINKLIYYETFEYIYDAINYEKKIKGWLRRKKIELIKSINPKFNDFSGEL